MAGLMTTLLDANIIIALLNSGDVHRDRVADFLRTTADDLCLPMLSLAEALVLQVRVGRGEQAEAKVLALGIRVLPGDLVGALSLAQVRAGTGLRMPDCVVLASAQQLGARLATTDAKLAAAALAAGVPLAL